MALKNIFKKKKEQEVLETAPQKKADEVEVAKKENKKIKKEKNKASATKTKRVVSEQSDHIIVRPHITEKAAILAHANQYVFVVHPDSNQIQIRNAVKELYGVLPVRVNVQNYAGKVVRFGRVRGKRKAWKKAIVTLPKGSKIDVYEGV
jgi:large subunit ribosomal protein L23